LKPREDGATAGRQRSEGGDRPRIGARPRSRREPAVSSETWVRKRAHEEREEPGTGTARGQSPRVTAGVLVRGDVLRGVSALRGGRGFHGRKRSEPQGRQQVATPAARARRNPARRCKTARSEQESEGVAALGRRARCSSTGDPESHRRSYGPGRIGALGVDARGPVVFVFATSGGSSGRESGFRAVNLSGGRRRGEGARRVARHDRVRTPGEEGRCVFARFRPGHEGRALERSPRSGGSLFDRASQGGRSGIGAKRKTSRTRREAAVNPVAERQGRGGSGQRPTSPLRVVSRMETPLGNQRNRPRPRDTGEPHESGPQGRTSWFERL